MPWFVPVLVFFARILDVSIGTIRIIVVIRGQKFIAALLGFFEVTIWLMAVSTVITNIRESLWTVVAYSAGFACGNLVGMFIEEKLALGNQMIRIVNTDPTRDVAVYMRENGFVVTRVEASGVQGTSELSFLVVPRRLTSKTLSLIREFCPAAFVTGEDVRSTSGSTIFEGPPSRQSRWRRWIKFR